MSYADTYGDAYAYIDSNADADCYGNCLIYAHGYAYCYTNGDSYGYADNYTYTNAHCQAQRNTEVAPHTGAASVRKSHLVSSRGNLLTCVD